MKLKVIVRSDLNIDVNVISEEELLRFFLSNDWKCEKSLEHINRHLKWKKENQ